MNTQLTEQIIKHIFYNLGIIESKFIDFNKCYSLLDKEFLLREKISFDVEGKIVDNNLWACQLLINDQELKIILGDVSRDNIIKEYCAIIHLKNSPMYALYLIPNVQNSQSLIAYSTDGKKWLQCNIYLQATFLAAMEQIKEHVITLQKCSLYNEQYDALLTFIDFHSIIFEDL